ncbi:MAG: ATP-binding protein [Chitinophagaceae bacterium]|nr:ATP-binding protein [Chitinophagaceae bacterium]
MEKLVGRVAERRILENALTSARAELVAIYGRRRVGKTFLIKSVYEKQVAFEFTGVHDASMPEQLENFGRALTKVTNSPGALIAPKTWSQAFDLLEKFLTPIVQRKRVVVFFDEFPWINSPKSNFLKSFDHFWNTWASRHSNLTVVICGSAASWMIQNIVKSKGGLHNRVTVRMKLSPFTLKETENYLQSRYIKLDRYQILQLYMVMGGIPQYLSGIAKGESAAAAIDRLCFTKHGYLIDEFDTLYASLFDHSSNHIALVRQLSKVSQGQTRTAMIKAAKLSSGGRISNALIELEESGFIHSYIPFGKTSNEVVYRLSDEYSLFYLKFMEKQKATGKNVWLRLSKTPSWTSWSGYAFESICMKHVEQIKEALGIAGNLVEESLWRYVPGKGLPGAQIDLLLDRDDRTINICEMKFSTGTFTINNKYAAELEQKREVFVNATKTKKTMFLTMVTTYGTVRNAYYNKLVQSELTMDSLFT